MTTPTQPPDKCPVCLETLVDRASAAFVTFVCGQVMYLDEGGDWKPQTSWECVCERAQQIAIALRSLESQKQLARDSDKMLYDCAIERNKAYAELTALTARVGELQAVVEASRQLSELVKHYLRFSDENLYCANVKKQADWEALHAETVDALAAVTALTEEKGE